ncbi:hypothetical protein CN918_27535 [Priestia megaterium]|nr:hypothetical protein CN918_27535 [Priestia megaterium]
MQRGQRQDHTNSRQYNYDENYQKKYQGENLRKKGVNQPSGLLESKMFSIGSIIYGLLFAVSIIEFITTQTDLSKWNLVTTFMVLMFHRTIIKSAGKAIEARKKFNIELAEKLEGKAWSRLGFALGFVFTQSGIVVQLLLGIAISSVFYLFYKKNKYTPRTITYAVLIMFIVNLVDTVLDYKADTNLVSYIVEKSFYVCSYLAYQFTSLYSLIIIVVMLLVLGRRNTEKAKQTNIKMNKQIADRGQDINAPTNHVSSEQISGTVKTKATEPVQQQQKSQETLIEDNLDNKNKEEVNYPKAGQFFEDAPSSKSENLIRRVFKPNTSFKNKIKEAIRQYCKL